MLTPEEFDRLRESLPGEVYGYAVNLIRDHTDDEIELRELFAACVLRFLSGVENSLRSDRLMAVLAVEKGHRI